MPRPTSTAISNNPIRAGTQNPTEVTQVVASPVDTFVAPGPGKGALAGLVQGLRTFSPALDQYVNMKEKKDADQAYLTGKDNADAQQGSDATLLSPPDGVNQAYKQNFQLGYRETMSEKMAAKSSDAMMDEYNAKRLDEGFDSKAWLLQFQQQELQGMDDPVLRKATVGALAHTENLIQQDARSVANSRVKEQTVANTWDATTAAIAPGNPTAMQIAAVNDIMAGNRKHGLVSPKEYFGMMTEAARAKSDAAGGDPNAFDFLYGTDPTTGKSFVSMNPDLAANVAAARQDAVTKQQTRMRQGMQGEFFKQDYEWQARAEQQGIMPSQDELLANVGPDKMFKTGAEAFAKLQSLRTAAAARKDDTQALSWAQNGEAWRITDPTQRKRVNQLITAPIVQRFVDSLPQPGANANDPATAARAQQNAQAVQDLVKVTQGQGDGAYNEELKLKLDSVKTYVPSKGEVPPAAFLQNANIYAMMASGKSDGLLNVYMSDEAQSVYKAYHEAVRAGASPQEAYQGAFSVISPEHVKEVNRITQDPQWQAKMSGDLKNIPLSLMRSMTKWAPFVDGPTNSLQMTNAGLDIARSYMLRNPGADQAAVMKYTEQQVKERFIYEPVTKKYVEVPRNMTGDKNVEMFSEYLKPMTDKALQTYGKDSTFSFQRYGTGDNYVLKVQSGGSGHEETVGTATLGQIQDAYSKTHVVTDPERAQLGQLLVKARTGTLTAVDAAANEDLLRKARVGGALNSDDLRSISNATAKAQKQDFDQTAAGMHNAFPPMEINPDMNVLDFAPKGNGSKTTIASQMYRMGDLAGALTTMGEGVRHTAYMDPASGQGKNIGIGYNFAGRANTLVDDFRRAGIPNDAASIEKIKTGKMAISDEQAIALYHAASKDYFKQAQDAVNARSPGAWDKLSKEQQAALQDIAYQTGNVAQFKTALGHLVKGEVEDFGNSIQVKYHRSSDGAFITDDPRNNLRSAMLRGGSFFNAIINEAGSKPTNPLQARRWYQAGPKGVAMPTRTFGQ